jgi:NADPH:quinone reductase
MHAKRHKAIQFNEFGGPEVLKWVEINTPDINEDQLLLKVKSAGINPIDAKIREGTSFVAQTLKLPAGMGFDICAEVVKVGSNITDFKLGDIVLGSVGKYHNPNAYAEYCIASPKDLVKKPQNLSNTVAGALTMVGLTAWQAIHNFGKIKKGEKVLIHAGAGGVGHMAIQYAKLAGAYVITTASGAQREFLLSLGADQIINYETESFEKILNNIDLVIDLIGGKVGISSLKTLKSDGRIVTVPTITKDEILTEAKKLGINATGMVSETIPEDLKKISELEADNKTKLLISRTFKIKEAAKAHEALAMPNNRGKIVLVA